ncbi:MAG: type 2 isopentenyl-diphosphate Delta-isomerase [Ignavibacteriaceae bacterium]
MLQENDITSKRKKEHIDLCLTDKVEFKVKTSGFEYYDFKHFALTEVDFNKISFKTNFFKKKINFPFLISCMTGGTSEAENINSRLAEVANNLNIILGVGSQRQALENKNYHKSYKVIRKRAPKIPILGNIGAAQLVKLKSTDLIKRLVDMIEADAMVVHLNPLQELLQPEGELEFSGLNKRIEKTVKEINVPVIVKEVGAGISKESAKMLLETGVKGIDVAGSGGTSWAGVEILRSKRQNDEVFWDWGLPTSYCISQVYPLKKKFDFVLIGSGGINSAMEMAKAFALGSDITASARIILQSLINHGEEKVILMINEWFNVLKKVLFLTGSKNLIDLRKNKIIRRAEFY